MPLILAVLGIVAALLFVAIWAGLKPSDFYLRLSKFYPGEKKKKGNGPEKTEETQKPTTEKK